jgi:peptidoglycan/LPS O-acetylase OafA/YrhL
MDVGLALKNTEARYVNLQVLRGVAVVSVVLFHLNKNLFPYGYFGVDVFFTISGYIFMPKLAYLSEQIQKVGTLAERISLTKEFFLKRFYRLAPALGVMLVITSPIILISTPYRDTDKIFNQAISSLLLLGNIGGARYQAGDYFANQINSYVHLWSLSAEEQIYLIIPTAILVISLFIRKKNLLKLAIISILVSSLVINVVLWFLPAFVNQVGFSSWGSYIFFSSTSRIFEFYIGFLISKNNKKISIMKYEKSWLLLLFLLLSILNLNTKIQVLLIFISTLVVLTGSKSQSFASFKTLSWLGDRSYSIYLWHLPIIYLITSTTFFSIKPLFQTLFCIPVLILAGNISFTKIEKKYRSNNDTRGVENRTLISILYFVLIPILVLSATRALIGVNFFSANVQLVKNDWYSSPSCLENFSFIDCGKNSSKSQKVAMIGDSHTQQDFPVFYHTALKYGFNAVEIGRTGCPFILLQFIPNDLENKFNPYFNFQKCFKENANLILYLKDNHITNIILNGADSGEYITQASRDKNAQRSWVSGISRSAIFLQQSIPGARIVILGPNPAMNSESNFPLTKLSIFQLIRTPQKTIPISEFTNSAFEDSKILGQFAFSKGILFLPTYQRICGVESCLNIDAGHFVFSDESHLTKFGAGLLIPTFSTSLEYFNQAYGLK